MLSISGFRSKRTGTSPSFIIKGKAPIYARLKPCVCRRDLSSFRLPDGLSTTFFLFSSSLPNPSDELLENSPILSSSSEISELSGALCSMFRSDDSSSKCISHIRFIIESMYIQYFLGAASRGSQIGNRPASRMRLRYSMSESLILLFSGHTN